MNLIIADGKCTILLFVMVYVGQLNINFKTYLIIELNQTTSSTIIVIIVM